MNHILNCPYLKLNVTSHHYPQIRLKSKLPVLLCILLLTELSSETLYTVLFNKIVSDWKILSTLISLNVFLFLTSLISENWWEVSEWIWCECNKEFFLTFSIFNSVMSVSLQAQCRELQLLHKFSLRLNEFTLIKDAPVSVLVIMPCPYTVFQRSVCTWPTIPQAKHLRLVLSLFELFPLSPRYVYVSLWGFGFLLYVVGPNESRELPSTGGVTERRDA